jgi:hypothetical protein
LVGGDDVGVSPDGQRGFSLLVVEFLARDPIGVIGGGVEDGELFFVADY